MKFNRAFTVNTGDKLKPKKPRPARKLTDKQLSFCKWYVSGVCNLNGAAAARKAGYQGNDATIRAIASQNLTKSLVRAEIDKRLAKAMAGADVTVEAKAAMRTSMSSVTMVMRAMMPPAHSFGRDAALTLGRLESGGWSPEGWHLVWFLLSSFSRDEV